jgi:hypothetical protein
MNKFSATALAAILSVAAVGDADAVSGVVTGQFKANISITIMSSIPTTTRIRCTLMASVFGSGPSINDAISETANAAATRSGSTATCQLAIPYRWKLFNSGDKVQITYSIEALDANGNGRANSISLDTLPVPASGSVTVYAPAAVI